MPLLAVALLAGCGGSSRTAGIRRTDGAVHAPLCFSPNRAAPSSPCRSPDGRWTGLRDRGPGRLVLTRLATGAQIIGYTSRDSCCDDVAWVRPHLLVFADDYRVFTLDPVTRKVTFLAGFSDFYASRDGRWLAGYAYASPEDPQPAGLVSLVTGKCVVIPGKNDYVGSNFGFAGVTPSTGFSPAGDAVVVATPPTGTVQYPISSLHRPCPASMTRKP
jgi:hypothetical protein